MKDDFSKYQTMMDSGVSPEEVYREAARDGLDSIARIRLIRSVYALSPAQAKAVWVRAEEVATSLDEHQGKFADIVLRIRPGITSRFSRERTVTTHVSAWFGRDEVLQPRAPARSGGGIALACEVGGSPSEPRTDVRGHEVGFREVIPGLILRIGMERGRNATVGHP